MHFGDMRLDARHARFPVGIIAEQLGQADTRMTINLWLLAQVEAG
jgi:hypothetical protein